MLVLATIRYLPQKSCLSSEPSAQSSLPSQIPYLLTQFFGRDLYLLKMNYMLIIFSSSRFQKEFLISLLLFHLMAKHSHQKGRKSELPATLFIRPGIVSTVIVTITKVGFWYAFKTNWALNMSAVTTVTWKENQVCDLWLDNFFKIDWKIIVTHFWLICTKLTPI